MCGRVDQALLFGCLGRGAGGLKLADQRDVLALGGEELRTVKGRQRLAFDDFGADIVDEELLDTALDIRGDAAVARVVVVDHAGDAQTAAEWLAAHLGGLDVDDINRVRAERDESGRGLEAGFALVNRHEVHAADGAFARLVGLDPRVHGALVVEDLAGVGGG